ncbi:SusC/RagA family TonB-linked outer membrane protein [Flexithrix dorotheae]|uniref:SusC/RagA family TonB-linked outer membrane protein n=1 Tax=Flexithrix dorotheae TaxID=70993 RepID=UPI000367B6CF|nr:TonB-dependent receptor [Flexithrix dorotheae]
MKKKIPIVVILICLFQIGYGQGSIISGTVTSSEDGEPIPGVSILIKGTSRGTTSDFNGNFSVDVSKGETLQFSYIGFKSKDILIEDQTELSVILEVDTEQLEEVVVIGYSSQKKTDLTGSIAVVDLAPIKNISTGNPMQALQGRVPGLYIEKTGTPTATNSRILIRGVNTLGDNNPLYIIDGVPTKRPEVFQSLNPGALESVQVLKDASASSIYGARASNGVVIVTTRNGSKNDGKVKVQLNSNFSVQNEKPQRYDMVNAVDRGRALWQASVNDRVDPASGYGEIYNFDWNGDFDNPILNNVTVQPFVGGDQNVPAGDTDWQEESYEIGYVFNNDLTVSGGNDKSSLLMNLGYLSNSGMLKYTNYDRISARLNAQTRILNDRVTVGMNTQFVNSNETLETPDLGSAPTPGLAVTLAPTIPVYTTTGDFAGPLGSGYSDRNNPVHMQYINRWDNTNRAYLFGNVFASVNILENLIFRSNLGMDYSRVRDKNIEPTFTEGFIARSVNSLTEYSSDFLSLTWSNTLNYKLNLGGSSFDFLLGLESVGDDFRDVTAYKEGFAVQTEEFFVLGAGTSNGNSFGTATNSRLFSQFGKINYNFSDKYLASVTLRRDGSSRFGADNRYGFFPAATVGWRISGENFLADNKIISNLKLRLGVGRVGNQDVGDFASLGLFEPRYGATASQVAGIGHVGFFDQYWNIGSAYDLNGSNTGNLPSGFVSVQAANPALKWETTDEINIGVDFGLFNNNLVGSFDYFTRETSDILIRPPVASAVGEGQLQWLNGATKENKGWEFSISYYGKTEGDFQYSIFANAGQFKDKITELPEEVRTAYPGNAEQTIVGHSELSIFGYVTDGIFQTQEEVTAHASQVGAAPGRIRYKDLNNDGKIDALDQTFLGTLLPNLEYGLRVDLAYKNFDFSIFGSGVSGKTGFNPYTFYNDFIRGRENVGPGVFDAWTPENSGSSIPALTLSDGNNETRPSDYLNVNASYFKLRNLQFGYSLPNSVLNNIGMEQVRIYFMAENFFWTKSKEWQGPDPERVDINAIPIPTTLTFGVNLSL